MLKTQHAFTASSLLAATLTLALVACRGADTPVGETPSIDAQAQAEATTNRLAGLDTGRLRALASEAIAAQRVHAPAGDNAVEYYLALRDKAPQDPAISTALVEFQPYVLIAAEQALSRSRPDEAERLLALLERMDAQAPSLPRLRDSLATLRTTLIAEVAARDAALARDAVETQRAEAAKEAASVERLVRAPTAMGAADPAATASALPAAAPETAFPRPDAVPPPPVALTEPAPARAFTPPDRAARHVLPQLLEDEAPRYPLAAMNRKIEGEVEVAFTIQPDGRVANARVVSADPAGVFDRAALAAAARWRFEATGVSASTSRTLSFRLPQG